MLTATEKAAALEAIRDANGGTLRPADVVDAAADKNHVLHECFDWNNKSAAASYRLWQAREIIASVRVEIVTPNNTPVMVRKYISLRSERSGEEGYRVMTEVMSNDDLMSQAVDDALAEMEAFAAKYGRIAALRPIISAAEGIKSRRKRKDFVKAGHV